MSNTREARQMLRAHRYGALSTLSKKHHGYPFGSITPYLVDHDGSLLILISTLAEHTKNIQADPRVSLITHNQESPQIQTQGRVTVLGNAQLLADKQQAGQRYLRYFPEAETYFSMHDFCFYRITPSAIRYIGGFGKIHWINIEHYPLAAYELAQHEADIIQHMNTDHSDTLRRYCKHYKQLTTQDAHMLGIDCDGFDVYANERTLRFDFAEPVFTPQQARQALVAMAKNADATTQAG